MTRSGISGERSRPGGMAILVLCALLVVAAASCSVRPEPASPGPTTPGPTSPDSGGNGSPKPEPGGEPQPTASPVEWRADGIVSPGEYASEMVNGTHRLFWTSTEETIRVAMQANTKGWVAVGFQPGSRMKNADIVFGMVVNGAVVVLDSYSTGDFGPHSADVKQGGTDDLLVVGGSEVDSVTTIEFERRLSTGDSRDVVLQRGVPMRVIWAYGSSDEERMQHSTRGYGEMVP